MNHQQSQVADFFLKAIKHGAPYTIQGAPNIPNGEEEKALRCKLLREETEETCVAIERDDIVEVADGLADLMYIVLGTALYFGIDIEPIFQAVHATNMDKFHGDAHLREDGKWIKPTLWQPPKIKELLIAQGWKPSSQTPPAAHVVPPRVVVVSEAQIAILEYLKTDVSSLILYNSGPNRHIHRLDKTEEPISVSDVEYLEVKGLIESRVGMSSTIWGLKE